MRARSSGGLLLEAGREETCEVVRNAWVELGRTGARKRPGQQLVQDDAERVDVRRTGGLLAPGLLRGEIRRSSEHRSDLGQSSAVDCVRDTEVRHLQCAVPREQEVLWLDVTMDEPALVGMRETCGSLSSQHRDPLRRKGPRPQKLLGEVPALDVLEDHERASIRLTTPEHAHDVWMGEPAGELGFPSEALAQMRVGGEVVGEELHGHRRIALTVSGQEDERHAPAADDAVEFVPTPAHTRHRHHLSCPWPCFFGGFGFSGL